MGQGFKEVASLRGDDKKFEENFAKIKWEKAEIYQCKECEAITPYELLTAGLCEDCYKQCPSDCGGCSCHINPPCTHCTNHVNLE